MIYKRLNWLSGRKKIDYQDYWDNPEFENDKIWNVKNGDYSPMEKYLENTGLKKDLEECLVFTKDVLSGNIAGTGMDLACGNMWAEPLILKLCKGIEKIYCLDYSKHRIFKLGPELLANQEIPEDKICLVLGDFYDLKFNDSSIDFIFMSQAFHHAEEPEKLLFELKRVLKPAGIVIIIGEHITEMNFKIYILNFIKYIISKILADKLQIKLFGKLFTNATLFPKFEDIYKSDALLGDHYYSLKTYMELFAMTGFTAFRFKGARTYQSFVLLNEN